MCTTKVRQYPIITIIPKCLLYEHLGIMYEMLATIEALSLFLEEGIGVFVLHFTLSFHEKEVNI